MRTDHRYNMQYYISVNVILHVYATKYHVSSNTFLIKCFKTCKKRQNNEEFSIISFMSGVILCVSKPDIIY